MTRAKKTFSAAGTESRKTKCGHWNFRSKPRYNLRHEFENHKDFISNLILPSGRESLSAVSAGQLS